MLLALAKEEETGRGLEVVAGDLEVLVEVEEVRTGVVAAIHFPW